MISLSCKELKEKGMAAVLEAYESAGHDMGDKQKGLFFRRFEEVVTETGQFVDAGGHPFTFDLWLETLDKVELDFSDDGEPVLPTPIAPPHVLKAMLTWEPTHDQIKRFREIIEKKRWTWRDRESDRRLAH
jgi:hypothetical protein